MDCASIRARNLFLERPLSREEAEFPVAFARIVFEDYVFVEAELAANFQPQNWYCFSVDSKANRQFRERMLALGNCFDNVIIPEAEFSVDSAGHHMGLSYMSCLNELARADRKWEYVITLQNHDVQVRTNAELVQIFKWLGGANDMEFEFRHAMPRQMIAGLNAKFSWTFEALDLFKNASLNHGTNPRTGKPLGLQLAKGFVQVSLARHFVQFVVDNLNLTKYQAQLDSWSYGADELFFQTLSASDDLNAPGGFTHKCFDQHLTLPYITRFSVRYLDSGRTGTCYSNIFRHKICMLGIEDLSKNLRDSKHLFVNKMMPWADFGAILCWHEEMRRRTLLDGGFHRLDQKFYQNWPQTRFNKESMRFGTVDLELFDCDWHRE